MIADSKRKKYQRLMNEFKTGKLLNKHGDVITDIRIAAKIVTRMVFGATPRTK